MFMNGALVITDVGISVITSLRLFETLLIIVLTCTHTQLYMVRSPVKLQSHVGTSIKKNSGKSAQDAKATVHNCMDKALF